MRIIVDTDVLWKPRVLQQLADQPADVVVPAIVFTERARQYRKRGWSPDALSLHLRAAQMVVEDFRPEHGLRYAARLVKDGQWKRLARDAMIAGHLEQDDILWTGNAKDFLALGVPEEQIHRT